MSVGRAIFAAAAVMLAGSAAMGGYSDQVLALNPVGYWSFSTGPDSIVNGYTGTLVNGASITASGGPVLPGNSGANPALLLDGNNQYCSTSLTGHITSSGTIMAWFYLSADAVPTSIRTIAGTSTGGDDFDLQIEGGRVRFYTDGGSSTVSRPLTTADLNRWHFVAATFTAGQSRSVYLDNDAPVTGVPGGHGSTGNAFWIGESGVFRGRYFPGMIDEVAVFDRELSGAEVALLQDGGICNADFNHDGDSATDADIEAFFSCLAGNCCATCGSADFNGDGDVGTDADIEAFFRVLAGGSC